MTHTDRARRGIAAVAIAAGLACGMAGAPTAAFAVTATQSYTWQDGQRRPQPPEMIERDGVTYTLRSTSDPSRSGGDRTVTQHFETTVRSEVAPDAIGDVQWSTPGTTWFDQDGFAGELGRTGISYSPVYEDREMTEEGTRSGTMVGDGSSHPDDSSVPETAMQNGHEMRRGSVSWERQGGDAQSTLWRWTATYSGTYSRRVLARYDVVASYAGDLSKRVDGGTWSMTATYDAPDPAPAEQPADGQPPQEAPQDAPPAPDGHDAARRDDRTARDGAVASTSAPEPKGGDAGDGGVLGWLRSHPLAWGIPSALAVAAAIVAAIVTRRRRRPATVAAAIEAEAAAIPVDVFSLTGELIELSRDGSPDGNQHVVATCDVTLSPAPDVPTLVEVPQPPARFTPAPATREDGTPIVDEAGEPMAADYYVVIGDTSLSADATAVTGEDGTADLGGLAEGRYVVVASDPAGTLGVATAEVDVRRGVSAFASLTLDGSVAMDASEILRDDARVACGTPGVRAYVTDADGSPLAGAEVDVLRTGLMRDAASGELAVAAGGRLVYRGPASTQVKLDGDILAAALNGDEGAPADATEEIAMWHAAADEYDAARAEAIAALDADVAVEEADAAVDEAAAEAADAVYDAAYDAAAYDAAAYDAAAYDATGVAAAETAVMGDGMGWADDAASDGLEELDIDASGLYDDGHDGAADGAVPDAIPDDGLEEPDGA